MAAPKLTKASVTNALAAVTSAGLTPTAMVIQADGSIRLEFLSEQLNNVANSEPSAPREKAPKKWGEKR